MPEDNEIVQVKVKKWWPHLVLTLAGMMVVVTGVIWFLATTFPVPDDAPAVIPFPDEGENVPGPEWLFLMFWAPFWYFKGRLKKYLFLATVVPIILGLFLFFLPYFHKIPFYRIPVLGGFLAKIRGMKSGFTKSFIYGLPAILFAVAIFTGIYRSGHQAKVLGCDSCHNPAMGHRMAIPPVDVAGYYNVERAMQIGVGKYRAGKSTGIDAQGEQIYQSPDTNEGYEGYKDADWQMRHMYEPTFTW